MYISKHITQQLPLIARKKSNYFFYELEKHPETKSNDLEKT